MEKKRSKGVTFWGLVFIVFGFLGILNLQWVMKVQGGWFLFSAVLSAATVATGIFVLKLNEMARKAVIILGIVSIVSMPFWFASVIKYYYSQEYLLI